MTKQRGDDVMSALSLSSPPQNPNTPDDRVSDEDELKGLYHEMRATLVYIKDKQLQPDQTLAGINAAFRLAITQMLLSAQPAFVLAELTRHIGALAPMQGLGMPGLGPQMPAPGATPMPQVPPPAAPVAPPSPATPG